MTAPDTTPRYVPTPSGGRRMARSNYLALWLRLREQPSDSVTLGEAAGVGAQRCRELLWAMVRVGALDVVEWHRKAHTGLMTPIFAVGTGDVAPYPGYLGLRRRAGHARDSVRARSEMLSFGLMLRCLREGTTLQRLAEELGGSPARVGRCLRRLHKARAVFIATWERPTGKGQWLPVYELGTGKDVPKPAAIPKAELARQARARRRTLRLHAAMCGTPALAAATQPRLAAA